MTYSGHAASSTTSAEALTNAAIFLLGAVTPALPRQSSSERFLRSASDVGNKARRGRRKASIAPLPRSRAPARCNDRHEACPGASPK